MPMVMARTSRAMMSWSGSSVDADPSVLKRGVMEIPHATSVFPMMKLAVNISNEIGIARLRECFLSRLSSP